MLKLDELGSLQFARFCSELLDGALDRDDAPWGFSCLRREGVVAPTGRPLVGPALVLAVWLRDGSRSPEAARRLEAIVEHQAAAAPLASLLLLTNVAVAPAVPGVEAVVLGPGALWELLRARPALRLRLPFLLGVAELSQLLPADAVARSSGDVAAAGELARVFVPTPAYARALDVLEQHRFVVLSGPPEMGKTAIARMLGLAALSDGWELHECMHPDELWRRLAPDRRQLFVADDAFGSTEYRPDTAERWALELDRVLRTLDDRHRLIWTSRPTPLQAALRRIHREHGVERFPQPAQVGVDAAGLDAADKALILYRHTKAAAAPEEQVELVRAHGWEIVSHLHFTPERIRRFVAGRLAALAGDGSELDVAAAVAAEIREPTAAMAESYRALPADDRAVLLALLDTPPGPVGRRELGLAVRRHARATARPLTEVVDRLSDHFLRSIPPASVGWVHPSWRDLVIDDLAGDDAARSAFLGACSVHGAALALSTAGGSSGERELPLLRRDSDWDALADRLAALLPELHPPETGLVLAALVEAAGARAGDARGELDALAAETLDRLERAWEAGGAPVPVGLLGAWLALAAELPEPPRLPAGAIAATWIELLPTDAIDLTDPGQVSALDDWLAFAELLAARAPDTLAAFGFPERQTAALQRLAAAAPLAPYSPLLVRGLDRLAGLVPQLADEAAAAADALVRTQRPPAPEPEPPLRELSPELERLLRQPLPTSGRDERALVARVLRDL